MIGFGPPDDGECFTAGSEQLTAVAQQLKSALPDDGWQGAASQAYADQDTALQNLVQAIADLDLQLAAAVKDQADWVTHMRLGFGLSKDLLFAAYIVEITVNPLPPPGGPLFSATFATKVCVLGIVATLGMLGGLLCCSRSNAAKANDLADQYHDFVDKHDDLVDKYNKDAAGSVATGTTPAKVAVAEKSTGSSFEAISSSMSGTSAMPDIAMLAGVAGGLGDERALRSAPTDDGETPEDETPAEPETAASTMPTLDQLAAISGQAAKASEPMNVANPTIGRLQQIASMAQRGQEAAAPAEETAAEEAAAEEAAVAGDVEGAGAASGTSAAERAPIAVPAFGLEPAQEPSPLERIA
jgi:hypothetical protein